MNRIAMMGMAALLSMGIASSAGAAKFTRTVERAAVTKALETSHVNVHSLRLYKNGTLSGKGSTNPGAFPESFKAKFKMTAKGTAKIIGLTTKSTATPGRYYLSNPNAQ